MAKFKFGFMVCWGRLLSSLLGHKLEVVHPNSQSAADYTKIRNGRVVTAIFVTAILGACPNGK